MAPKRKSTPSQNPLCFGASLSSDPTPSHLRFRDEKARKDFSENFSQRGIHSERQVILSDFFDTDLPIVIYSRSWESLCGAPVNTCVGCIARRQAVIGGFIASPLPIPKAFDDDDNVGDVDATDAEDDGASSSSDDTMST
ncbi:hypothetical protein SO802_032912 [Lithocarpus litseifolius]|uniref:Uncharacterized protein n=1 Tax=Lithocarpus litseifolius TaxID=425828 RepID=A0AAW2BDJ2_9ROSI